MIAERTGGRGVNVILDVVGAPYWDRNIASLAVRGRLVLVGTMAGGRVETNIGALMPKRLRVHGTVLRARPLEEKLILIQQFMARYLHHFESGRLRPVIDRVFPLEDAAGRACLHGEQRQLRQDHPERRAVADAPRARGRGRAPSDPHSPRREMAGGEGESGPLSPRRGLG